MKQIKRLLAVAAALCLCLSLSPAARAQGEGDYSGESWDDIVAGLLEEYEAPDGSVHIGYMNLESGEEHYLYGEEYVVAASMYKLPLCMAVSERIDSGEIDWDSRSPNLSFDDALREVIVDSNNETAGLLYDMLGGYSEFRRLVAEEYLGTDPAVENEDIYYNNQFTPRQMISCLKALYDRSDEFSKILGYMREAEPERFFRYTEQSYEVAHKYGFWQDEYYINVYTNDCGIVYTDEPIALVMFTNKIATEQDYERDQKLLSAYCAAMCEYTQYQTENRQSEPSPTAAPTAAPTPTALAATAAPAENPPDTEENVSMPVVPILLIALLMAACLAALAVKKKKYDIRPFWALLCILTLGAALLLCVIGMDAGTVYAKPEGDPQTAISDFFEAVKSGDYSGAYAELRDYSTLGLESVPDTEAAQAVNDALRKSYDYELLGACQTEKLDGVQRVRLRYMDISLIQENVEKETMNNLKQIVRSRPASQVYDENKQYLPDVANEAYIQAVKTVVAEPEQYYTETEFDLAVAYTGGRWQIVTNPTLLKALNGGAGY